MARDDMHVIIYRILSYLYECNKHGKTPVFSGLYAALELPDVPDSYLASILSELVSKGYVKGVDVVHAKGAWAFTLTESAGITMDGAAYLSENGRMKQAAQFAGKAFELLLSGLMM